MSSVLLCGYGWASRVLWQPALADAGFDNVAVLDAFITVDAARSAGVRQVHRTLEEAVAGAYDLAVVASPNLTHTSIAIALLERGIPTVVEKPVCLRAADVDQLRSASERGGAPLLRSRSTHYDPHVAKFVRHARDLVPFPEHLRVAWTRAKGVPRSPWLTREQHAGAGSCVDLGWHLLECVLDLSGSAPLTLRNASFTAHDGGAMSGAGASWHGIDGASTAEHVTDGVDVDVASQMLFIGGDRTVEVSTAWCSEAPGDEVVLEVAGNETHTSLTTLLGMSASLISEPRIETTGRPDICRLPARRGGASHARMVAEYATAGFDPARLGQTWQQLAVLAAAAEEIVTRHARWRVTGENL